MMPFVLFSGYLTNVDTFPDWIAWIRDFGAGDVAATGARIPGDGKLAAIEDAPGRYVKSR
jgi:polyhydroxyalkanoate synthase